MRPPSYIILDFETTGLDPSDAEIIEIGAILVEGLEAKDRFHALVKPVGDVPPAISKLTGITPQILESERPLSEVVPAFLDFVRDLPMVAHNAKLEQSFLDQYVTPISQVGKFSVFNSIEPLAMILPDAPSHSLENLRRWAGMSTEGAHRADQDCEDLLRVMIHAREYMRAQRPRIATIVRELLAPGSGAMPWWWSWYFREDLVQSLEPETRDPAALLAALERPFLGDLRELRTRDAARGAETSENAAETGTVPREVVGEALAGKALGDTDPAYQHRPEQEAMAQEVRDALNKRGRVALEAPTGTGKSVAYLLPGVLAARNSGTPLVVSTHSKSLQDQLLEKDIPRVRRLLGDDQIAATTVKGQENYLCLRKLHELLESRSEDSSLDERWGMAYLTAFASVSRVAELDRVSMYIKSQFASLPEQVDWVRSHHTTTIGPQCPFYKSCHFFDSARHAHHSDVIVANHSLVFQWPAHLPQIRDIVFDEAHHLEDQITDSFTVRLSESGLSEQLDRFARKRGAHRQGDITQIARLMDGLTLPAPWAEVDIAEHLAARVDDIRSRLVQLRAIIPMIASSTQANDGYEVVIDYLRPKGKSPAALHEGFANLAGAAGRLADVLGAGAAACEGKSGKNPFLTDATMDLLKTHAFRFGEITQKLKALLGEGLASASEPANEEASRNFLRLVHWNPHESVWRFTVAPIEVSKLSQAFFASKRGVVLTSATLSAGTNLSFIPDRIGLELTKPPVSLPSPYDLAKQAIVYLPQDLAPPGTPSHLEALIDFTENVATLLGGRTLLLMTSNRRLKHAAEILRAKLEPKGITVYDSLTDRRAAEAFKTSERALLIGSERYGEGLDIPGKALSLVVVEKINEAMTRSPLAEARKARTKFALFDYDFPLRMMWLKQRVGRLIRSPSDTGAVVVFDSRYHAWGESSRAHVKRALAPIPIRGGTREEILGEIEKSGI